jgi:hypothetical protein
MTTIFRLANSHFKLLTLNFNLLTCPDEAKFSEIQNEVLPQAE